MHEEYLPGYDWEEILEKDIDQYILPEKPVLPNDDLDPLLKQDDSDEFFA